MITQNSLPPSFQRPPLRTEGYKDPISIHKFPNRDQVENVLCIGECFKLRLVPPSKELNLFFADYDHRKLATPALGAFYKRKKTYPDAIVISQDIGKDNIRLLLHHILSDIYLKQIPTLLCCESSSDFILFKKEFPCLDDAIGHNKITAEVLLKKIRFFRKIKKINLTNLGVLANQPAMHRFLYAFDHIIRHILDIIIATMVLAILSPILLLIALIIKIESKGPVFYASYRAGRGYRIFRFYKFRSMVYDADIRLTGLKNQYKDLIDHGPAFFKVANDPRITPFGMFLRKTSLDELPQLLNVLKGDMSLVGNRPLPLYEAATLTTDKYAVRFLAPAGITGLWQLQKRGKADMSATERVGLDIAYAHKHSFWYDMKIMCRTPFSMTQKEKV